MRTKGTPRPSGVPLNDHLNDHILVWLKHPSSCMVKHHHAHQPLSTWCSSCTFTTACSLPANKQQPDPYCPKESCFTAWGKRCHAGRDSFSDSQHCCPKYASVAQVTWNARCQCSQPKIKRHKAHLCDHHVAQSALWCCTCEMDDGLLCASQTSAQKHKVLR